MVEWITIIILAMMLLDLNDRLDALRTEGRLISSGATGNNSRRQRGLIGLHYFAEPLG